MKRIPLLALSVALAVSAALNPLLAQRATQADILNRQAEDLANMWDGAFDTANQVNFQERFDLPVEGWIARHHKIFKRVDLPAFSPTVTYVEQYAGEPPEPALVRQRLYVHSVDSEAQQVITDIYAFREGDAEKVIAAHEDPSKLAAFTPENMDKLPDGCAIRWAQRGDTFVGTQTPEECLYTPEGFGQQVRLRDTITLSADAMVTETEILAEDNSILMANDLGVAEVARKARAFTCMVLAQNQDLEQRIERYAGIKTHDQGGIFEVSTQHTPPKDLRVRLLKIIPPAGPSRHTLIMQLTETNDLFPTAMAFVAPDAPRVAISIAGIEANCTADDSLEQARF